MAQRVIKSGGTSVEFQSAPQPLHIADLDSDLDQIFTNITDINVAVGAGIQITKLDQSGATQLVTAQYGNNSITQAKLAPVASVATSAVGTVTPGLTPFSTVETTLVTVTITLQQGGRFVFLGGHIGIMCLMVTSVANAQITMRLYRDSNLLTACQHQFSFALAGQEVIIPTPMWADNLATGTPTHVYKVTAQSSTNQATLTTTSGAGTVAGQYYAVEMA